MMAIGIGCRRNTPTGAIESMVRQALIAAAGAEQPSTVMAGEGRPPLSVMAGESGPPPPVMVGADQSPLSVMVGEGRSPQSVTVGEGRPPQSVMVGEGRPSTPFSPHQNHPALFTIEDKANEPGLIEAARSLGLTLTFLARATLRAQPIRTRSPRAEAAFGVPSVAEAAALAGAGPNAVLILPRITAAGVTCAIATTP